MRPGMVQSIFSIEEEHSFQERTLEIFRFQSEENPVYREFIERLRISRKEINIPEEIPFLPIGFFKTKEVITGSRSAEKIFESSGTTGSNISRHYVTDTGIYNMSLLTAFKRFYGDPSEYLITALLPSYTERAGSSLVYMMDQLIRLSDDPQSGFYGNNPADLLSVIKQRQRKNNGKKILLIGVSFALLDLAENFSADLSGVIVMETGGMKGRRKEITREELHSILKKKLNVPAIHSEYGMTELLSQAYSQGEGIFRCPPWMKVLIRDPQDPLSLISGPGRTGGINIIDLANIYSCSFLSTSDLGKLHADGSFEVLGRFDSSDIRGCNLLIV
jgi:phenylacetate-coenzyme A ligase PaaK-like adenylate-forming protein